jgi:hypothetical protein
VHHDRVTTLRARTLAQQREAKIVLVARMKRDAAVALEDQARTHRAVLAAQHDKYEQLYSQFKDSELRNEELRRTDQAQQHALSRAEVQRQLWISKLQSLLKYKRISERLRIVFTQVIVSYVVYALHIMTSCHLHLHHHHHHHYHRHQW